MFISGVARQDCLIGQESPRKEGYPQELEETAEDDDQTRLHCILHARTVAGSDRRRPKRGIVSRSYAPQALNLEEQS
jgi:hypothetical protein